MGTMTRCNDWVLKTVYFPLNAFMVILLVVLQCNSLGVGFGDRKSIREFLSSCWEATHGRILTTDNVRRRGYVLLIGAIFVDVMGNRLIMSYYIVQ